MVFGNRGDTSGTGVAFSRDPGTGVSVMKGEYLINAQGEDVVAGIRTPEPIARMKEVLPEAYDQFIRNVDILEDHFKDMQDVEFTVVRNTFYSHEWGTLTCSRIHSNACFPDIFFAGGQQTVDASMPFW